MDNVLSKQECEAIINSSEEKLSRSTVLKGESEEDSSINDGRTSKNAWLLAKDLDTESYPFEVLLKIEKITQSFSEKPIENQEGLQVLKYDVGEQYEPHHDFFHDNHKEYERCMAEGGQRLWTVFFYLSDVEEGGDTFWPRLDVKVSPKAGRVAIWQNIVDGEVYHPSLHWGMPPTKGTKWACTKWVRERAFNGDLKAHCLVSGKQGEELSSASSRYPTIDLPMGEQAQQRSVSIERKTDKPIDSSSAEVIIV